MAGEFLRPFAFAQITAHAGCKHCLFDQTRDFLVVETIWTDILALAADAAKQWAFVDPGELDPGLDGNDRAGGAGRTTADLDLTPAGFARNVSSRPLSSTSIQPKESSLWSRPRSSPTIFERLRPPAKPSSNMARSRRPRRVPRPNVSSGR